MFDERDVLLKAASIVEQGWCQKQAHQINPATGVEERCLIGAINAATNELGVDHDVVVAAYVRIHRQVGKPAAYFNDTPGRTVAEVADAMRQAAIQET